MPGVRRFALLKNAGLVLAGMVIALLISQQSRFQSALAGSTSGSTDASAMVVVDQQTGRGGFDPLSIAEQDQALKLAMPAIEAARGPKADPTRTAVLLVERHEETKAVYAQGSWSRRADVYAYDYARDVLLHAVVNLQTSQVDQVDSLRDIQLPLTADEHSQALSIALADSKAGPAIREQYRRTTNAELQSSQQIQVSALVFRADAMPGSSLGQLACGIERCAQLLLATGDGALLNITVYIDLSRSTVLAVQN